MKNNKWFTLVEVIVAITIFSLMMVSVIMIFAQVSKVNRQIEVNRTLQENIKKAVEFIWEDVRLYWWDTPIEHDSDSLWDRTISLSSDKSLVIWDNQYYLANKDENWTFFPADESECWNPSIKEICYLVKQDYLWDISPLTNSQIHLEKIRFNINNSEKSPRVTIMLTAIAARWTFRTEWLVESTRINFQTTFWRRIIPNVN